jgi:uncharacterized membrane protein YjgN (DUF898 family)
MFTILGGDGKEYGPVTAAKIQEWIQGGRANLQTKAKRAGEADWKSLGEFPEFTTPAPLASPAGDPATTATTPAVPASVQAAPATGPRVERFVFTGDWTEYFKIWIVNVLLTIVTLGIYAAWAKVRKRRYFYANTKLFGHAFEYLADPIRILIGNIIIGVLFFCFAVSGAISPLMQFPFMFVFAFLVPWFILKAYTFNARNSAWCGLRFQFTGRYWEALKAFLFWPLLVPLTLGLAWPWVAQRQKAFVVNHHNFGTTPFRFSGTGEGIFGIFIRTVPFFLPLVCGYFIMIFTLIAQGAVNKGQPPQMPGAAAGVFGLLFLVGIPLAIAGSFYFRSRMFNYVWNHTAIASQSFTAHLRARDLFLTQFVNSLVTAVTFGLLYPWGVVRMVQLQLDSLQVISEGSIDQFVSGAQPTSDNALGEAATDFFDIDFGFGL